MCRNRQRRLSASDSSRVALEVSTTNGARVGGDRAQLGDRHRKSDSTSSSSPSISMSALSVSSISSTVGSVRRMAVSSGRDQQELLAEDVGLASAPSRRADGRPGSAGSAWRGSTRRARGPRRPPRSTAAAPGPEPVACGDRPGQLGLADPGRTLDQQRLAQPVGEEHRGGGGGVGQIAGLGQPPRDVVDVGEQRRGTGGHTHSNSPP